MPADSPAGAVLDAVRTASAAPAPRITGIRIAAAAGYGCHPILRIDAIQGIGGPGERRAGASPDAALRRKRLMGGPLPGNVDDPFKSMTSLGGDGCEAGGHVMLPEAPGPGIERNAAAFGAHLRPGTGFFDPTEDWNRQRVGFDRVPHH